MNPTDIAVIGLACRLPGARDADQFWANLCAGRESIHRFDAEQLRANGIDPARLADPRYVPAGGVLDGADSFDAGLFEMTAAEATISDPQHLVLLECAWTALEHAGYPPRTPRPRAGIFVGSGRNTHLDRLRRDDTLTASTGSTALVMANDSYRLPTLLSYRLNLRGPSLHVQTACSTSLVAVHLAAQSLLAGECDLALAGGVNIHFPQHAGYVHEEGGIESPDGHCRVFDADAAGTVFGNGAGLVVLRRAADALRDGDPVLAVLRGSAINNDGSDKIGFTAPGIAGQVEVIREALAVADIDARSIGYVEAHGTGTALGDPIEISALTTAYRQDTADIGYCRIGSVKSNLGHLDAAAGIVGLIKAVLAVKHGVIPASLHFTQPNPHIPFSRSPFTVAATTTAWLEQAGPRRAAVSSFGLGGSNAHVIVEEPPAIPATTSDRQHHLVTWSAAEPAAASTLAEHLSRFLAQQPADAGRFADLAHTLRAGRAGLRYRASAVLTGPSDASSLTIARLTDTSGTGTGVAYLLPGQGSQRAGMAARLHQREPVFAEHLETGLSALDSVRAGQLRRYLLHPADETSPPSTLLAQLGLFVTEQALARLWQHWGLTPVGILGHSVGEYVAAHLAGVLSLPDAVTLVARRGELMDQLPPGQMLAVGLPEPDLAGLLSEHSGLDLAAINSLQQLVLAGPAVAVTALAADLDRRGIAHRLLRTRHAFHSRAVDPLLGPFAEAVAQARWRPPTTPFVSGVTGDWITDEQATDPGYWVRHLRAPVRFADGLRTLLATEPAALLEVGPGQTMSALARQQPVDLPTVTSLTGTAGVDDEAALAAAAGHLWCAGVELDWDAYEQPTTRRRRVLPGYPFQRQSFALTSLPPSQTVPTEAAMPSQDPPLELSIAPLIDPLRRLFADLLRCQLEQLDPQTPFAALGADSLSLLQASRMIRERFGVSVPFRALLEEHSTIDALAQHLRTQPDLRSPTPGSTPVIGGTPPTETPPGSTSATAAVAQSPAAQTAIWPAAADSELHGIIRDQLDLMAAQLTLLGAGPIGSSAPASAAPGAGDQAAPAPSGANGRAGPAAPSDPAAAEAGAPSPVPEAAAGAPGRYVPYRRIDPGSREGLSPVAHQHIADLISTVRARTGASRAAAERDRSVLADERRNARFRSLWKEIQYPLMFARGEGAIVHDLDGNRYVDLTIGFGALLFGHNPPELLETLRERTIDGLGLGIASPAAGQAARLVRELTGLERVAFVNSGTDAIAVAVRLARTVTGRTRIAMFAGSYHGANDQTLVRSSVGDLAAQPIAPGLLPDAANPTVVLEYGSPQALDYLRQHASELAAVLVEPVQSRRPGWQPRDFLRELSAITRAAGAALILDEVITGFRTHPGGLQARWRIEADLCTFGKVAGGGLPIGIVAGSARFLDAVDGGDWQFGDDSYPSAETTYVAGTFFRHPLLLPAVVAMLDRLQAEGPQLQERLDERAADLVDRMNKSFAQMGVPITAVGFSSWFVFEFGPSVPLPDLFFLHLAKQGVYVWEGRICYLSTAHTDEDLDQVVLAVSAAGAALREAGLLGQTTAEQAPALDEALPVTDGQSELWTLTALDPTARAAQQPALAIRLHGQLDQILLRQAVDLVTSRHAALRAGFAADGRHQHLAATATVPITVTDEPPADESELTDWLRQRAGQPFDPVRPPLLRLDLRRLADDEQVLLLTADHLVCDGAAIGVLAKEIGECYAALTAGRSPRLPPPASYRDYLRERIAAERSDDHWRQRHRDLPPLQLPTDTPRPAQRTFTATRVSAPLPAELAGRLRELSSRHAASPTAVLLAGYFALLRLLTGGHRLAVGIFADDRYTRGGGPLVADAVSLVPLAVELPPGSTLADLIPLARTALADGYDHRHFSLRQVIRDLGLLSDASRPPLIATTFNLDEASPVDFGPLAAKISSVPAPALGVDVAWNVVTEGGRLRVEADVNEALLHPQTVLAWIGYYADLLLDRPIRLPAPPEQVKADAIPAAVDLRIAAQLAAQPDRVLLAGRSGQLTGAGLDRAVARLAGALHSAGVRPGDLVGIALGRDTSLVSSVLASWRVGAAFLPLDPAFPAKRLTWIAADAGVRLVLTDRAHAEQVHGWGVTPLLIEEVASAEPVPQLPAGGGDRLAYVMYTSGSTGRPKGIAVPHSALATFAEAVLAQPGLSESDTLLSVTTLSFDISLLELIVPLCAGAKVVVAADETVADGLALAELLDRHQVSVAQATPAGWRVLLAAGWTGRPRLRVLVGGEALPPVLARRLTELAGPVWNLYGPTEATVWATTHQVVDLPQNAAAVPIGRPLAGYRASLLGSGSQPVPPTVLGELCLAGPAVAWGYQGRPALTATSFRPDPAGPAGARLYHTGDVARQDLAGVLEFHGRNDHQVKIRGHRIELGEIEAVLSGHEAVAEAVCVADRDRLVAYLVPRSGAGLPTGARLRSYAGRQLPAYMVPTLLVSLDRLPLTANGKIDRSALPRAGAATLPRQAGYRAPRSRAEKMLARIWSELLDREKVGVHDNFLELGGDSIAAVRASAAARAQGIAFTPQQLLRQGSISALLATVEHATGTGPVLPVQRGPDLAADLAATVDRDRLAARLAGKRKANGA